MIKMNGCLWAIAALTCIVNSFGAETKRPNIVFIVADDLGWNDVGFHNPDMITPNIDKLAKNGVMLNQSYVQPVCSPSRHSFMTGYYPWKAGLQHLVIGAGEKVCSPLNMTFFPKKLQQAGYATHAVGKWHLGFCSWNCTPLYRGFDSFYGYFNSREDYYTHVQARYLDFHDGYSIVWNETGSYSANLYATRAEYIISKHDKSKPLFLYLPYQSVHEPLEVPPEFEALYPNIKTKGRRKFCGMVTALDAAIGRVIEALQKKGLYDDTIFFFTPDNGGWIPYHGNNWPLRGGKITIWEGGTRTAGFVSGARLQKTDYSYEGMMHAVDWHPTILEAAGIESDPDIDGISQWKSISTGQASQRTEFIYNLDDWNPPTEGHAAIRVGDYKLISGYPGHDSGWYPPDKEHQTYTDSEEWYNRFNVEGSDYMERIKADNVSQYKLFNLKDDPTEHNDLAKAMPDVVAKLVQRMGEYHKQMVPAKNPPADPKSNPKYFGDVWTPGWCDKPME